MKRKQALVFTSVVLAGFVLVGCKDCGSSGASSGAASATASASAAPSAAVASASASASPIPPARMLRRAGPLGMLFEAAKTVELKPEQKTAIEGIESKLHAEEPALAPREEMKALNATIVAGVKAGKIDETKLDTHYAAIEKAAKANLEKDAEALNALHAVLDPEQRKSVVAKARAKSAARDARFIDIADGGKAEASKPDGGRGGPPNGAKRRIDRLTRGLDLDDAQKANVDAIVLKDAPKPTDAREAAKKRTDALLDAFEKDTFDAKKLELVDPKAAKTRLEQEGKTLAKVVPILTPEQREKLATRLDRAGGGHIRFGRRPNGVVMIPGHVGSPPGDDDEDDE